MCKALIKLFPLFLSLSLPLFVSFMVMYIPLTAPLPLSNLVLFFVFCFPSPFLPLNCRMCMELKPWVGGCHVGGLCLLLLHLGADCWAHPNAQVVARNRLWSADPLCFVSLYFQPLFLILLTHSALHNRHSQNMFDIGLWTHSFVYVFLFHINGIMLRSHSISVSVSLFFFFNSTPCFFRIYACCWLTVHFVYIVSKWGIEVRSMQPLLVHLCIAPVMVTQTASDYSLSHRTLQWTSSRVSSQQFLWAYIHRKAIARPKDL